MCVCAPTGLHKCNCVFVCMLHVGVSVSSHLASARGLEFGVRTLVAIGMALLPMPHIHSAVAEKRRRQQTCAFGDLQQRPMDAKRMARTPHVEIRAGQVAWSTRRARKSSCSSAPPARHRPSQRAWAPHLSCPKRLAPRDAAGRSHEGLCISCASAAPQSAERVDDAAVSSELTNTARAHLKFKALIDRFKVLEERAERLPCSCESQNAKAGCSAAINCGGPAHKMSDAIGDAPKVAGCSDRGLSKFLALQIAARVHDSHFFPLRIHRAGQNAPTYPQRAQHRLGTRGRAPTRALQQPPPSSGRA